jgi:hypothetical protein
MLQGDFCTQLNESQILNTFLKQNSVVTCSEKVNPWNWIQIFHITAVDG